MEVAEDIFVAVNDVDDKSDINVYPVPTSSVLNVQLDEVDAIVVAEIVAIDGTTVRRTVLNGGSLNQVDVSQLVNGTYLLKLSNAQGLNNTSKFSVVD